MHSHLLADMPNTSKEEVNKVYNPIDYADDVFVPLDLIFKTGSFFKIPRRYQQNITDILSQPKIINYYKKLKHILLEIIDSIKKEFKTPVFEKINRSDSLFKILKLILDDENVSNINLNIKCIFGLISSYMETYFNINKSLNKILFNMNKIITYKCTNNIIVGNKTLKELRINLGNVNEYTISLKNNKNISFIVLFQEYTCTKIYEITNSNNNANENKSENSEVSDETDNYNYILGIIPIDATISNLGTYSKVVHSGIYVYKIFEYDIQSPYKKDPSAPIYEHTYHFIGDLITHMFPYEKIVSE